MTLDEMREFVHDSPDHPDAFGSRDVLLLLAEIDRLTKECDGRRALGNIFLGTQFKTDEKVERLTKERDEFKKWAEKMRGTIEVVRGIVHAETERDNGPGDGFLDRIVLACREHKGLCFCGCHITRIND